MASKTFKLLSLPLRLLASLLSLYVLAAAGYHIHRIKTTPLRPSSELYAISAISGVGGLWTLATSLIACFFSGKLFVPILIVDVLLCAGFVAVAVLLRDAATADCPASAAAGMWRAGGTGETTYDWEPMVNCKLDKAAFAVSVANAAIFLVLAWLSYALYKNHKRNKAFGPGPENGYDVRGGEKTRRRRRSWEGSDALTTVYEPNDGGFTRGVHQNHGPAEKGVFDPELGGRQSVGGNRSSAGYDEYPPAAKYSAF